MPNPSLDPTSPSQPNMSAKTFLKSKNGKLLVFFVLVVIAGVMAYAVTKNQINFQNPFKPAEVNPTDLVNKDTNELTDKAIGNIKNITLDDVREASNSTGIDPLDSPSLSDEETSKKIYNELGNKNPQNYNLSYSDYGISLTGVEIKQGDMVTWTNVATSPMSIVGEGWENGTATPPQESFTYTFFFLGEYKYKINDTFEGVVDVVK